MSQKEAESYYPESLGDWREWLKINHKTERSVWVICYKKDSDKPSLAWSDLVDEALCFGWIDSTRRAIDDEKFKQYFSKRKPNGTWSKINKEKVELLIADGRMTEAGLELIRIAKENGSWNILDDVEALIVPEDLKTAFEGNNEAKEFYEDLSKSLKKQILSWLVFAKREETRKKRIDEIIDATSKGIIPNGFR